MKRILTLFVLTLSLQVSTAQVFWTEDFDFSACAAGCGLPYAGDNGSWTQATLSAPGDSPNRFYVSCAENGQAAGICGAGCGSDNSLHVGSAPSILGDIGAAFYSGDAGIGFGDATTNIRAESPTINCMGKTNITVSFNYIENGDLTIDNAQFWYFDGATWTPLFDLAKTSLCPSGQGLWTAYSMLLPASADNNSNVKIGYSWINNNDASGTDPSFAVDDITLSSPSSGPVASYSVSPSTICVGDVVTFTNTSTGGPFTSASWTFVGGTPSSSTSTGMATTTYSAPGTYTVQFVVNTASATDTVTGTVTVVSCASPPVASFTISATPICEGDCISFTNTSTSSAGSFTSGWVFAGASTGTSTSTSPTGICYPTAGTYTVTLIVNDVNGTDTATATVTVTACSTGPTALFSAADTICRGDCLSFNDMSTGAPTSWSWSFGGGTPTSSTAQNPTGICFGTNGTYTITLTATNAFGSDSYSETIVVQDCIAPSASFNIAAQQCLGYCVTPENTSTNATSYSWSMPGATPSTSTAFEPQICYYAVGSYTITLVASNASGSDTYTFNVTVDTVPVVTATPDFVEINLGDDASFTATANGPVYFAWTSADTASLGDTTQASITVTPTSPGTVVYYVYAVGGNGCAGIDTVIVEVTLTDVINVPNGFSPNGDGFNDELKVLGPGISSMKFLVYNRYGQEVFSSTDQTKGWDGTHKGKAVDPGVFAWYVEYILVNGITGSKKGNVTLIK